MLTLSSAILLLLAAPSNTAAVRRRAPQFLPELPLEPQRVSRWRVTDAVSPARERLLISDVVAEKVPTTGTVNVAGITSVRRSTIEGAGLGAFALRDWKAGETVGRYMCAVVRLRQTTEHSSERDKQEKVTWGVNRTHGCDASNYRNPRTNPMSYVNSVAAEETCGRQNVVMRGAGHDGLAENVVLYVASRDIAAGEELLADYGPLYFLPYSIDFGFDSQGVPIRPFYECGIPSLHKAAARGDTRAAVSLLVEAESSGRPDALHTLVNSANTILGAPAMIGQWTALSEAAIRGHLKMVELLLAHGAIVDHAPVPEGTTALYWAARNGHVAVVEALLRANAHPDDAAVHDIVATDQNWREQEHEQLQARRTPLIAASERGHVQVVEVLLREAATDGLTGRRLTVDAVARSEFTALCFAAQNGHAAVVKSLVRAGANKEHITADGRNPLGLAAQFNRVTVVQVLVTAGAVVQTPSSSVSGGRAHSLSALCIAKRLGHRDVEQVLLAAGADWSSCT